MMKPFWDNLFYDMKECGLSADMAATRAGNDIRSDLRHIEDAIRNLNGRKAIALIEEMKAAY